MASDDSVVGRILGCLRAGGDRLFLRSLDADLKADELSYRDFFLHALITAGLYDRFKVPVGATVVLILSKPRDVFLAFAGALLTGRVPIVSAHPSAKLSLTDFSRALLPLIDNAAPALIVGDPEICAYVSGSIGRRVASFQDIDTPKNLPEVVNAGNPALFIQYSSGTTGTKKGVMISERQLLWQIDAYAAEIGLSAEDRIVSWLPYYHDMGLLTALLLPLITGTEVTVMSPFDWVKNPLSLMEAAARHQATLMWLPNFSYNFLAQAAGRANGAHFDLSCLRGIVNCSEPVSADSHAVFLKAFARHGLAPAALAASYAMAETTFAITSGGFTRDLRLDHVDRASLAVGSTVSAGDHAIVSSGRALAGTELRIFGVDRAVLGDRRVGEIGVRSPSVMSGYFKNDTATAAAYAGEFFLTGDLGYTDGGEVYVTGRIKDLIITSGRNIYPQDIEAIVSDVDGVVPGRCVAFGVTDDAKGTETVVVIAEARPEADAKALSRAIAQAVIARFDISLADVLVVEPGCLAKSTSGKIARGRNRERYLEQRVSRAAPRPIDPAVREDVIRQSIFEAAGVWIEDDTAPLVTSGLIDSLALTGVILALETAFSRSLPLPDEAGYDAYDSIKAIAELISSGRTATAAPFVFVIDRQVKVNYVLEGPRNFDTLILGSSRSYLLRTSHAAKFGARAFQFAVAGARFEEVYAMAAFFSRANRTPLKHIIVGTDPIQFAPHLPVDLRCEKTPPLFSLLESADQAGTSGLALEDVNDATKSGRLEKLMRIRYSAWDVDIGFDPVTGDVIRLFGRDVATLGMLHYTPTEKSLAEQFLSTNQIDRLHPRRLHYLDKLLRLTEDLGCKLSIYTNPLPPHTVAALRERTPYYDSQHTLVSELRARAGGNVAVHAFVTPKDFNGFDDDFFDAAHIGVRSADRLLGYLMRQAAARWGAAAG